MSAPDNIDSLIKRYDKHVALYAATHAQWNLCAARGLRKLIVDIALATGDDQALNHAWGAPHWLTLSDEQVTHLA